VDPFQGTISFIYQGARFKILIALLGQLAVEHRLDKKMKIEGKTWFTF